jgi:hypothetical protein
MMRIKRACRTGPELENVQVQSWIALSGSGSWEAAELCRDRKFNANAVRKEYPFIRNKLI